MSTTKNNNKSAHNFLVTFSFKRKSDKQISAVGEAIDSKPGATPIAALKSINSKNLAIQQSSLVALAGQTRGAIRVVLDFCFFCIKAKEKAKEKAKDKGEKIITYSFPKIYKQ